MDSPSDDTSQNPRFDLDSGALCLDFANTVSSRAPLTGEKLVSYPNLVSWGHQSGMFEPEVADKLRQYAVQHPRLAATVLRRAVSFRELLYRVFSALAAQRTPDDDDLWSLNAELEIAMTRLRVAAIGDGFGWRWRADEGSLDQMLWPAARSAADLLVSNDIGQVRECASDTCSWLFLDHSRNKTRRWCDMSSCGNREKARRHYRRKKLKIAD